MPHLSVTEAAARYPLSPTQLRHLARTGTIRAQRYGATYALDERSLQDYLATDRKPGRKPRKGKQR